MKKIIGVFAVAMLTTICTTVGATTAVAASGKRVSDDQIAEIQKAIDEQRYFDAAGFIDQAVIAGSDDSRLSLLTGELSLARGRLNDALTSFKSIEANPSVSAQALQGEGIALSRLNRSNEAVKTLEKAVAGDPGAWRAWNALGTEYDRNRDWSHAESAYDQALSKSQESPVVLNNRGYSRLLQNHLDEAIADFISALQKKPGLAEARTNLRLAVAMKGEYSRALEGATPGDKAALLNNAGFAAILRGDYAQAKDLLNDAMKAKGDYYARASENLELAEGMKAHGSDAAGQVDATH